MMGASETVSTCKRCKTEPAVNLMGQPAAKCKEDASGDWTAYRQVDGLWTIRNRQTGMRVAVDLAEPDALLCAQARAMREALDKIQVWLMAPAVDKETLKEMYELARRAIEGA